MVVISLKLPSINYWTQGNTETPIKESVNLKLLENMEYLFSKWSDGSKVYHIVEIIPSSGEFAGRTVEVKYRSLDYVDSHTTYLSRIVASCDYIIGGKKINIGGYGLFDMNGDPIRKPELQEFLEKLVKAGDL